MTNEITSAVTETIPEPETAFFCQNRGEPKPRFLEPSEYGFAFRRLCLYMVQSQ